MSNRFHSKYHRTNHHTDTKIALSETDANGVPTNPDTGHDPIASPEHPFMGLFSLRGGLSACTSDTNPLKTAGFFISRKPTEDACRFSGNVKLSGDFVMDNDLIHADTDTNKVGININPSSYTNYDLIVNQSLFVIENTNTKTLSADFVKINTTGSYDSYPLNVLDQSNDNSFLTVNKTGNVGINLGPIPNFENKNFKVIGDILFDSSNDNFHVKGSTQINDSVGEYTTKIGTNNSAGQVSLGRNGIVKLTTNSNLSADCDIICSKNIYLSGNQDIVGNLNIQGNLSALGTFTQLDTIVTITSSMSVKNEGTTTALVVTQTGNTDIADFRDESESILFIDNDKRVGILNNNPQYTLDVKGNIHTTENIRINGNKEIILGSDTENSVYDATSLSHQFTGESGSELSSRFIIKTQNEGTEPIVFRQSTTNNETNRLVIGSDGKVGINSSLTAIETFPAELTVYGSISANQNLFINGTTVFSVNSDSPAVRITQTGSGDALRVEDSTNLDLTSFIIDPSGRVGIGTNSIYPEAIFDVRGGRTSLAANNEQYALGVRYVSTGGAVYFGATSNLITPDAVISNAEGFALATFTNNGNVGIGSTSPTEKLTVSGNISAQGMIYLGANYTGGGGRIYLKDDTQTPRWETGILGYTNEKNWSVYETQATQTRLTILTGGNVGINTSTPNERLTVSGNISASGNISIGGTLNIGSDGNLYRSATNTLKTNNSLEVVGTILVPDGSALTPSIANTDDTNNGIFFPAIDTLAFATSGIERFRIDSFGSMWEYQQTHTTKSTSVTATLSEIQSGIIVCSGTAAFTLTLPTPASLDTNLPAIDTAIEFSIINTTAGGGGAITIAANGNTAIGSLTVALGTSARFSLRKTGVNAFTLYRLS
jgi:hypothetical protein